MYKWCTDPMKPTDHMHSKTYSKIESWNEWDMW
jgi:hypothetical protein